MELLPEEIVNEILLLVDRPSLYYVSQVCKQWRHFSLKQVKNINVLESFVKACNEGDLLSITQSTFNQTWVDDGLESACCGGHKDIVELMIAKGANFLNYGLYNACREGHKDIVKLMIAKGANTCRCGKSIEDH